MSQIMKNKSMKSSNKGGQNEGQDLGPFFQKYKKKKCIFEPT